MEPKKFKKNLKKNKKKIKKNLRKKRSAKSERVKGLNAISERIKMSVSNPTTNRIGKATCD
jgi:hypothetical protein